MNEPRLSKAQEKLLREAVERDGVFAVESYAPLRRLVSLGYLVEEAFGHHIATDEGIGAYRRLVHTAALSRLREGG